MFLEAAHTSDASFDPAMVLFKTIVQVDARSVTDVAAQCRADRARVRIMPVGCHPVRHKAGNRACRAEEPPSRFHVTGRAQHRVDEIPVAIDRPIQVAPAAMDLEVDFVSVLALTRAASNAVSPLAQRLAHHGQRLRLPPPDRSCLQPCPALDASSWNVTSLVWCAAKLSSSSADRMRPHCDCPYEANQLPRDRGGDHRRQLSRPRKLAISPT